MSRKLLLLVLGLASCSEGSQADLAAISQARSLGAEWALVNEQAQAGHLTATYVRTMHQEILQQLQTTARSLTQPHSRYGSEIAELMREPADAAPNELRSHVKKLKREEDELESA